MTCDRCRKQTGVHTMSMFNTQEICMDCEDAERKHPKYREANEADIARIKQGDYNFKGIGKPSDL